MEDPTPEAVDDVPIEPRFRLTRVRIQNFRCIRDLTLDLDDTTVLIGENNSGKTAVLKAIELCLGRRRDSSLPVFDEYDYHLADENASPQTADPICVELTLAESSPGAMPAELREDLADILVADKEERRELTLRVQSGYDPERADFSTETVFLDAEGEPMQGASGPRLATLRRAVPVHFLPTLRDPARHFGARGPFWRDFLSSTGLSEAEREAFEEELTDLNRRLIAAHPPLQEVQRHLQEARKVIAFGTTDPVAVEPLPAQASALLSQARVNMTSRRGAKIPLERQGEGAQSLAVLLLFGAHLRRRLDGDEGVAAPITLLEEPEAHLHPAAVRALKRVLDSFPGQKIFSTHSGELVGRLKPQSVRRLVHRDGQVCGYHASLASMSSKDRRTLDRTIRRGRGDLLFARCWLVYEGETEAVLLPAVAEALGVDLDRAGVALIQCSDLSPAALFQIANGFGIPWYFVYDGDEGRSQYEPAARKNLDGAEEIDRFVCPYDDVEALLRDRGFADLYPRGVTKKKVAKAARAAERMIENPDTVPAELEAIVRKAVELAKA